MAQPRPLPARTEQLRHCPNPECPYLKRYARAAEYRAGIEMCSDCGAGLVEGPAPHAETARAIARHPAPWSRLGLSAAAFGAFFLLRYVPLPGVRQSSVMGQPGLPSTGGLPGLFSLGALGINPALSAFLLVELFAVVFARTLRTGGFEARARLWRAAWIVTAAVGIVQGLGVVTWLESIQALLVPGTASRLLMAVLLAAPAVLAFPVAAHLSRRGLGNGFSVLMLLAFLDDARVRDYSRSFERLRADASAPTAVLILLLAGGVLHQLLRRFVRPPRDGALEVPLPASGIEPLIIPGSVLALLSALGALLGTHSFDVAIDSPGVGPYAVRTLLLAASAALLGWLFNRRPLVADAWAREAGIPHAEASALAHRKLREGLGRTLLFLGLVYAGQALLAQLIPTLAQIVATGGMVWLLAVIMDLAAEWRFRREHGELVAIRPVHRVYESPALLHRLRASNLPVLPRGYHHRALLQFFGPQVPIELHVPAARREEALRALEETNPVPSTGTPALA